MQNVLTESISQETHSNLQEAVRQTRWKLFVMLPRMLLHRSLGGGHISKSKLEALCSTKEVGKS